MYKKRNRFTYKMKFYVDQSLFAKFPALKIGLVVAKGYTIRKAMK